MKEKMRKIMKNEKGFTLIEMIVVMAIIGVLAAILIPSMSGFIQNSRNSQARADVRTLYTASAAAAATLIAENEEVTQAAILTQIGDDGLIPWPGNFVADSLNLEIDDNGGIDPANSTVQHNATNATYNLNGEEQEAAPGDGE